MEDGFGRVQNAPHFHIHFTADSFAAQNMASIESRLERAREVIESVLTIAVPEPINVYLSEMVIQYEGYRLGAGGYAVPSRLQIHDVFRPDSPGENLERSLLEVCISRAIGTEEPPDFMLDGLLVLTMQQLGSDLTDEVVTQRLAAAKSQDMLPPVAGMLAGQTPVPREVYYAAAAGFVGYTLRARGITGLAKLAAGPPADISDLERAWRRSIKALPPGGTARFVRLVAPFLAQYKRLVAEVVIYITLGVIFTIVMTLVPGWLVDVLHGQPAHILNQTVTSPWPLIGALAIGFVAISILTQRQTYLTAFVTASILTELRLRAFTVLQRLHPGFFQDAVTGDIISRMTADMSMVEAALTGPMTQTLQGGLTILLAFIVAFHTNWQMTLATMVFMPLFFVSSHFLGPRAAQRSMELQQQLAQATSTLQENLGAQPVVKAFGLQEHVVDTYSNNVRSLFRATLRLTSLMGIYGWAVSSTATGINLFILAVGAWMVLHGQMTAGILIQFLGLVNQIIGPVHTFAGMIQSLQQSSASMNRVNDILDEKPLIADRADSHPIPPLRDAIVFENVSFGYSDDQPTVRDLNLTIAAGTRVAIIGRSGSGKSTTISMILRFYDPSIGRVTFDGTDIRAATLDSLRAQFGVVFQDNVLFNGSIRENIRLGNLAASDSDVMRAAQLAEIHDFIMGLPEQYETEVGERGARLSGGQRQRIAIARAIVREPAILLLDEATSALDPVTEAAINDTLIQVGKGRTTITVTHRLASIRDVDRIYVLEQGSVVESGTHDELLRAGGIYAELWADQGGTTPAGMPRLGVEVGFLRRVPLFATLQPELLAVVATHVIREEFGPGVAVVSHGDAADKLFIIQTGRVEVLDPDPAGGNRRLAILREGDHFGELALLHDTPRTATVRTITPSTLYSLSRDAFGGLLESAPGLGELMAMAATEREALAGMRRSPTLIQPRSRR